MFENNVVDIKANAEANGIKTGNIEFAPQLNIMGQNSKSGLREGLALKLMRAFRPELYVKKREKIAEQHIASIRAVTDAVLTHFPWFSEPQAFLFSMGYNLTQDQVANVFRVIEEANSLEGPDAKGVKDPEIRDLFIQGAASAYDVEAQRIWSAILNEECVQPGRISKPTMRILSNMGAEEVRSFNMLVGCSVEVLESGDLIPLIECDGLDEFSLPRERVDALDSLGLTRVHSKGMYVFGGFPFDENGELEIKVGDLTGRIVRKGESTPSFFVPELTKFGKELSLLCQPGSHLGFAKAFSSWLSLYDVSLELN